MGQRRAMGRMIGICSVMVLANTAARAEPTWKDVFYDPGAANHGVADLILPMPCGGAMAFQRVDVPMDATNPLDDIRLRLGQSETNGGFSEYLRFAYLRGPFEALETDQTTTYYYISRYELTNAQMTVLRDPTTCAPPKPIGRLVAAGLSWFDGVDLGRRYSEWLYVNAKDQIPHNGESIGFIRLPTEVEWEYAARGGAAVSSTDFGAPQFPMTGALEDYAHFQGSSSGSSSVGPAGGVAPNPLGIFDLYGNAEEMMLGPFHLNAVGREHGQDGGLVTRGGSFQSSRAEMYSAKRTEWPMFSASTGAAQALPGFGVRFVISSNVSESDQYMRDLQTAWMARLDYGPETELRPQAELEALIKDELDPARKVALESVQHALRVAQADQDEARKAVLRSTIFSGTISVMTIRDDKLNIAKMSDLIVQIDELLKNPNGLAEEDVKLYSERVVSFQDNVKLRQTRLAASLETYRGALLQMIDPAMRGSVTPFLPTLFAQLRESGQSEIILNINDFIGDIEPFAARPDMSKEQLIELADQI